jgi:S1-C subfamily serine protease
VTKVTVGSPAEEAGLEADDVLLEVDRKKVTTPNAVLEAIRSTKRDFIPLAIERKGTRKHLSIERP